MLLAARQLLDDIVAEEQTDPRRETGEIIARIFVEGEEWYGSLKGDFRYWCLSRQVEPRPAGAATSSKPWRV